MKIFQFSNNISSFKTVLKEKYPNIKPTHLSEAMARGLGYKTYASLLTAIKGNEKNLLDFNQDVFNNWLVSNSYSLEEDLSFNDFQKLDHPIYWTSSEDRPAKSAGKRKRQRLLSRLILKYEDNVEPYYVDCEKEDVPFVVVRFNGDYANIEWDTLKEYYNYPASAYSELSKLAPSYYPLKPGIGGSLSSISTEKGYINYIPKDKADEIALKIFEILYNATNYNSLPSNNMV